MYKVQEKPDGMAHLANGSIEVKPLVTLKDEHGGVSHIIMDDHCYVLINGRAGGYFAMVKHWYQEAAIALRDLLTVE